MADRERIEALEKRVEKLELKGTQQTILNTALSEAVHRLQNPTENPPQKTPTELASE